jgi:hypothetical protein
MYDDKVIEKILYLSVLDCCCFRFSNRNEGNVYYCNNKIVLLLLMLMLMLLMLMLQKMLFDFIM